MRSSTPLDLAGHCPRCLLRFEGCLCAEVPRIETRCRFIVLRHTKEAWRTSNTARLAALAIPRCQLVPYGTLGAVHDFHDLVPRDAWLLFPDGCAGRFESPVGADPCIVVLDGSWRQARRMLKRVPVLQGLRRLSLPAHPNLRLRRPTVREGMSTLEAIAGAVALTEGTATAEPLLRLYRTLVRRSLTIRGRLVPAGVAHPSGG